MTAMLTAWWVWLEVLGILCGLTLKLELVGLALGFVNLAGVGREVAATAVKIYTL